MSNLSELEAWRTLFPEGMIGNTEEELSKILDNLRFNGGITVCHASGAVGLLTVVHTCCDRPYWIETDGWNAADDPPYCPFCGSKKGD